MCQLKYTYIRCAREGCARSEYIHEMLYPCLKPQNCNGFKQMTPVERIRQEYECSIHFYADGEEDESGPFTERTEGVTESADRVDEILRFISSQKIRLKMYAAGVERSKLHMRKSYMQWCDRLDELDDLFNSNTILELPDLSDCGAESDESVISDNEYVAFNPSATQPRMR